MNWLVPNLYNRLRGSSFLRQVTAALKFIGFDYYSIGLFRVARSIRAGNFNAAAAHLESIEKNKDRFWGALIYCYFSLYRFDDLISAYESMPNTLRDDPRLRYYYFLALANLKRLDEAVKLIQTTLKNPPSKTGSEFLSQVYPFTTRVSPEMTRAVVDRILPYGHVLVADHFDSILNCAHGLRGNGWNSEALRLESALRSAIGSTAQQVNLDLLEAQTHFVGGHYALQFEAVNRALQRQEIDPVSFKDVQYPFTCCNLKSSSPIKSVHGPLVSILMPAFNATRTITYALDALQKQSYTDFELIVIDDGSNDGTANIVEQFIAADPRFRLISIEKNVGTYVAKNIALAAANGEFVTTQDADDWAHPQKIATQVAELQRDPSIIGTWVEHIRCSGQRGFRALGGYLRPDASSLMFRRQPVMERIGWYDSVRAAGDGEFHLRMERAFGRGSVRRLNKLLSFVSWTDTSLSGTGAFQIDDNLGIFSPDRSAYRRAFGYWHETTDNLYMPFPLEHRSFPAPKSLLPLRDYAPLNA